MTRKHQLERSTSETKVKVSLNLDGTAQGACESGIGFLDHMLDLLKFHSGFDLDVHCDGDLETCAHHSVEDVALALGEAFDVALGDKKGIRRYATCNLPMDECLTRTSLDISGRPYHVFMGEFEGEKVGEFPTEMTKHFFYSFAMTAKMTLHQEIIYGSNDHHKIESLFKGLARALKEAVSSTGSTHTPSTKGVL